MRMNRRLSLLVPAAAMAAMIGATAPAYADGTTAKAPYRSTACEKANEIERTAAMFMGDPVPQKRRCQCTDTGMEGSDTRWSCTLTDDDSGNN